MPNIYPQSFIDASVIVTNRKSRKNEPENQKKVALYFAHVLKQQVSATNLQLIAMQLVLMAAQATALCRVDGQSEIAVDATGSYKNRSLVYCLFVFLDQWERLYTLSGPKGGPTKKVDQMIGIKRCIK